MTIMTKWSYNNIEYFIKLLKNACSIIWCRKMYKCEKCLIVYCTDKDFVHSPQLYCTSVLCTVCFNVVNIYLNDERYTLKFFVPSLKKKKKP